MPILYNSVSDNKYIYLPSITLLKFIKSIGTAKFDVSTAVIKPLQAGHTSREVRNHNEAMANQKGGQLTT